MGRPLGLVGSTKREVPACPYHPGSAVVLNGTYGKLAPRQRFLCRPADGAAPHKFTFDVPRVVSPEPHCGHCENPVTHLCEHHLRMSVLKPMRTYGLTAHGSVEMGLLNDAFGSTAGWWAYAAGMRGITVQDWITRHNTWVTRQGRRRPYIPARYSIGALEMPLQQVREFMERRAFCYRNTERTNRMLELVRLRLNKLDDPLAYTRSIRQHLENNNGQLPAQGTIRDPHGHPQPPVVSYPLNHTGGGGAYETLDRNRVNMFSVSRPTLRLIRGNIFRLTAQNLLITI